MCPKPPVRSAPPHCPQGRSGPPTSVPGVCGSGRQRAGPMQHSRGKRKPKGHVCALAGGHSHAPLLVPLEDVRVYAGGNTEPCSAGRGEAMGPVSAVCRVTRWLWAFQPGAGGWGRRRRWMFASEKRCWCPSSTTHTCGCWRPGIEGQRDCPRRLPIQSLAQDGAYPVGQRIALGRGGGHSLLLLTSPEECIRQWGEPGFSANSYTHNTRTHPFTHPQTHTHKQAENCRGRELIA